MRKISKKFQLIPEVTKVYSAEGKYYGLFINYEPNSRILVRNMKREDRGPGGRAVRSLLLDNLQFDIENA